MLLCYVVFRWSLVLRFVVLWLMCCIDTVMDIVWVVSGYCVLLLFSVAGLTGCVLVVLCWVLWCLVWQVFGVACLLCFAEWVV